MFSQTSQAGPFRSAGTPAVKITINGQTVSDWLSFQVDMNSLGAVDSYEVTLPWEVTDTPQNTLLYSGSQNSSFLVSGSAVVRIEAWFEKEGKPVLLVEGPMDQPRWSFSKSGEVVTIYGRSYASRALDFKESLKMQNLTSTQAFKQIAAKHGLKAVVPVETKTLVGEYTKQDHVNMMREVSHWDYILYLAQNDGFVTRVSGTEWYYGPREQLPGFALEPVAFTWGHNIPDSLEIERAPNAARNLIIEVISWIPSRAKIRGTGQTKGQRIVEKASFSQSSDGHKYTIRYYYPNITRDEAQRRARAKLQELFRSQVYGTFPTDWFPELQIDRKIRLYGVGKGLSQEYYVSKITVTGSKSEGLSADVTFSNLPLEEGGTFG